MLQYISSPSVTAKIISEYNIRLKKSLGQNFLIDTNLLKKIVKSATIGKGDVILEIGCGIGSLTQILLDNTARIVCVEMDKKLICVFKSIFKPFLKEPEIPVKKDNGIKKTCNIKEADKSSGTNRETTFSNFFSIDNNLYPAKDKEIILIENDAMKLNYSSLCSRYKINKIVANLPYKISAPLILKLLIEAPEITEFYLTIQKDIADRIFAKTGQKNYSSYTLKANFMADYTFLFNVPGTCFIPVPFVDSVFIKIIRKKSPFKVLQEELLKENIPESLLNLLKKTGRIDSMTKPGRDYTGTPESDFITDYFNFLEAAFLHRRKKLLNSLEESYRNMYIGANDSSFIDKLDLIAKMLHSLKKRSDIRAEELKPYEFLLLFLLFKVSDGV